VGRVHRNRFRVDPFTGIHKNSPRKIAELKRGACMQNKARIDIPGDTGA